MLKNRIIPCLDVKNGRVVKGINFIDLKDAGDPVEQAKIYSDGGADEICFLDITASNENRNTIYDVVEKTSKKCFVPLTVGGGIRSVNDINKLLNCGADKVSINTAAVQNSEVVLESSKKFGSQCIVVAIDAKKKFDKWEIFTHGGRNNTGIDAIEFATTGIFTLEDIFDINSISYPTWVPSLSIEVINNSPAPLFSIFFANSIASILVLFLPP